VDVLPRFEPPVVNSPLSRENKESIRNKPKGATVNIVARYVIGFNDFFPCSTEGFETRNKISWGGTKYLLRKDYRLQKVLATTQIF